MDTDPDSIQPEPIMDITDPVDIRLTYRGEAHSYTLQAAGTLMDLANLIESELGPSAASQKFLVPSKGLLKHPFSSAPPLSTLSTLSAKKPIQLLAPTSTELQGLTEGSSAAARAQRPRNLPTVKPSRARPTVATLSDGISYTFHRIVPLPYLPNPAKSTRFLERLRDDPGIRAAMAAHRFSVGTLTEMDPAMHTTHESRTLGLNRNAGEVIELRLRTDAYDGYRDYRTIRKTLCHELAHNVHGPHDRNFWDLCHQIEKEVDKADWKHGGHRVSEEEFYNPDDDGGVGEVDGGGWTGGSFVLGGEQASSHAGGVIHGTESAADRRAAMARAAEERMRKQQGQDGATGGGGSA